ncbi:hypothetical protein ACH3XW_43895 [Acanthocheilonema viteae]|uniref:Uncharacterized protein n=1 Tax=Acanthocheilonema viteae TaxID=6277 RepID=A0A498SCS4_ACAVI|nr:unnamed protein product [Acanthocheilonema viteae]
MSAKRKSANIKISDDEDDVMRVLDDGSQQPRPEMQNQNVTKKTRVSKKQAKNTGVPVGYRVEELPPEVIEQMNRQSMQPPYAIVDPTRRTNTFYHSVMVNYMDHPINIAPVYAAPPPCWCNQLAGDLRAIRELIGAVSNGIHCILQKVHMDQVQNADMMSKLMNTVEVISDTVTHLPLAQLQEYDQYLVDDTAVRAGGANPVDVDPVEPYYVQNDAQIPPDQPPNDDDGNYQ